MVIVPTSRLVSNHPSTESEMRGKFELLRKSDPSRLLLFALLNFMLKGLTTSLASPLQW